jgi:L-serine dehydratase
MPERSSVFDMIGPVMIGPSSSHTAGVVKIAAVAVNILGSLPDEAEIVFYNSFARTYEGHGSDKAVIGGLLGYKTDDKRIKEALDEAKRKNFKYKFKSIGNASTLHPNTIKIMLRKKNVAVEVMGESRGGGVIKIISVNGFDTAFGANTKTMIITAEDIKGGIAFMTNILAHDECNIAHMTVSRKGKSGLALWVLEMDSGLPELTLQYIRAIKWVKEVVYLENIS